LAGADAWCGIEWRRNRQWAHSCDELRAAERILWRRVRETDSAMTHQHRLSSDSQIRFRHAKGKTPHRERRVETVLLGKVVALLTNEQVALLQASFVRDDVRRRGHARGGFGCLFHLTC